MAMHDKGGKRFVFIIAGMLLIVAALGFVYISQQANADTSASPAAMPTAPVAESTTPPPSPPAAVNIDVKAALAPRVMGDEKAPVTIEEFASLSCSHCAHFSTKTFEGLKARYIDTGKVRFIYSDFPTSGSALEAAMVARCLPQERYFQFVKFLFETQNDWAFDKDFRGKLKQNAGLLGLGSDAFDACVNSAEIKSGLAEKMEKASKEHEISSTPTFIINGKEKISGARDLPEFEKVIDPLLEAH